MDSTLNIEEKEIATKIGTQIDYADETKTIPQNNDNLNENQLESYIDSGFDKHVTSRDNEDDDDLKNEESESEDSEISEEKNTTNVEENPATLISKPSIDITSSDVERTVDIKDSESNNSIIIDASIKTDPSLSVENLPTVSENNLELDLIDGSTVGENSSNAENESTALDTSNILIKGEEDKAIEVCKSQYTKSSEEKNVNDPTSIANDLSTGNTKADLVLLNEPNVNDQTSSASDLTAENNKADLISQNKPEDFNSQILNIISDIDINIKAQEKITQLKEQELKLIQKQNDLANEIHKQQILAKQLSAQNQLEHNDCQSGELDLHSQYQNERGGPTSTLYQKNIASKEYANVSKTVDLRKIFTPATDAAEILPKNRKLYASSAFYSPTLHPTVEDQVELARRISHSLSDISNQTSKGQSMYVNRKKRSDKWVHEGRSQDFQQYQQRPVLSPNILPAYSDAGKHRVQLNIHQNQLIEKYSKPGLQVVQSPWKAALQTGSASSAFLEDTKSFSPPALTAIPSSQTDSKDWTDANEPMPHGSSRRHTNASSPRSVIVPSNPQRDLAYTPCVAQGWGGRSVELPKGLYVPKEISLSSYAAPSQQREIHGKHFERPYEDTLSRSFPRNNLSANNNVLGNGGMGEFPPSMPIATALNTGTLNQQPYSPTSYKKTVPGLEKVESFARYEQPDRKRLTSGSPQYLKALQNSQVRNASPISFGTSLNEQTSWPPGSVLLQGGSPSPLPNHVQTFNKCAKGWGSIPVKQKSYSSQFNLPGNLPYSDF
ncbi:GM26789 [Drosophila sechellia]|uniref:GM26789 n=1 Tax=Drosophila sechellia TaxID=7238 RepID=B4IIV0_DROSE|nr:GM26789 [Drosophila sechellia]